MVRKKVSEKGLEVPLWLVDGFVGILALMIYNFLLYLLTIAGIRGVIGQIEEAVGYFGLNSFIDFGFNSNEMFLGIVIFFLLAFFLGIGIGNWVRKKKR